MTEEEMKWGGGYSWISGEKRKKKNLNLNLELLY